MPIRQDNIPKIHNTVFIAEGVKIVGDVSIKKEASIWYNTVIRSDVERTKIQIGERTNIQDGTVVHVDHDKSTFIEFFLVGVPTQIKITSEDLIDFFKFVLNDKRFDK